MVYTYTEQENESLRHIHEWWKINKYQVQQKKNILLKEVLKRFDHGVTYTETEVNSILLNVFSSGDYVEQRRYLITFGFSKKFRRSGISDDGNWKLEVLIYTHWKVQVCDIGSTPHTWTLSSVSIIQSQERYSNMDSYDKS